MMVTVLQPRLLLAAFVLYCLTDTTTSQEANAGSIYQQCNQTIYEGQGVIASPNFPEPYSNDLYCSWTIVVEYGRTVTLMFGYFDVERSSNCAYDSISVYNGPSTSHPALGRFCGAFRPGHLVSTSNQMLVTMKTDHTGDDNAGFYAVFGSAEPTIATPDSCGGLLLDLEGSFHSPNYPKSDYPASVTCAWHIRTSPDRHINLYLEDFDIEPSTGCKYDALLVYGGWSNVDETKFLGRFCGDMENIPSVITSPGNEMFVTFVSDSSGMASGFKADYATKGTAAVDIVAQASICAETKVMDTPRGHFASPGYGTGVPYGNDLACSWRITAPEGARIQLWITDFNLEKDEACENDYVEIYYGSDESGVRIGSFCGTMPERGFVSLRNEMYIIFHTDSIGGEAGFRASYNVLLPEVEEESRIVPEVVAAVTTTTKATTTTKPTTTQSTTTRRTTTPAPTTIVRQQAIFYQCPSQCPAKIKFKTKICTADYIVLVKITDIKTLRAQSIVPVEVVKTFKAGSRALSSRPNLRIACRRCANLSRKTTYLIAGNTLTNEGIEIRPEDLSVRFKSKKHTKLVTKLLTRCKSRSNGRKGKKNRSGKRKRNTGGKKRARST